MTDPAMYHQIPRTPGPSIGFSSQADRQVHISSSPVFEQASSRKCDIPGLGFDATPPSCHALPTTPCNNHTVYRLPFEAESPTLTNKIPSKSYNSASQWTTIPPQGYTSIPVSHQVPNHSFCKPSAYRADVGYIGPIATPIKSSVSGDISNTNFTNHINGCKLFAEGYTSYNTTNTTSHYPFASVYGPLHYQNGYQRLAGPQTAIVPHAYPNAFAAQTNNSTSGYPSQTISGVAVAEAKYSAKPFTRTVFQQNDHMAQDGKLQCFVQVTGASENLARILPYDSVQRLLEIPDKCIANNAKKERGRCGHPICCNNSTLLSEIAKVQDNCSLVSAMPVINLLIDDFISGSSQHQSKARDHLDDLLRYLGACYRAGGIAPYKSSTGFNVEDIVALPGWLAALTLTSSTPGCVVDNHLSSQSRGFGISRPRILNNLTVRVECVHNSQPTVLSRAKYCAKPKVTYPNSPHTQLQSKSLSNTQSSDVATAASSSSSQPVSKPFSNKSSIDTAIGQGFTSYAPPAETGSLSVEAALRYVLTLPFNSRERENAGHIYIYWTRGNFGYVKIGVTTRSVEQRLKEWKRKCKHDIESHSLLGSNESIDGSSTILIPHVYRVEKLVHTELRQQRKVELKCQGCGSKHREWFLVSPEHAKKVVLKWSQWIKQRQHAYERIVGEFGGYEEEEIINNDDVAIEPEEDTQDNQSITEADIESVCKPLELSPFVNQPRPKDKTHLKTSVSSRSKRSRKIIRSSPRNISNGDAIETTTSSPSLKMERQRCSVRLPETKQNLVITETTTKVAGKVEESVIENLNKQKATVLSAVRKFEIEISAAQEDSTARKDQTIKLLGEVTKSEVLIHETTVKLEDAE